MRMLIAGNDAAALAALHKGCRFGAGYPITPSTECLRTGKVYAPLFGARMLQLDFEIYSVSACKGFAAAAKHLGLSVTPAGVPFSPTSGPGYFYYGDQICKMATCRLPGVFLNIARAGPGLGNIFWGQADYFMVVKGGGNGDYRVIVLAPSTIGEMWEYTQLAFDLAIKYQTPVVLLADGRLGQSKQFVDIPDFPKEPPKFSEEYLAMRRAATYPRSVFADFDLDAVKLRQMNYDLQANYAVIAQDEPRYEAVQTDGAEVLVVAFGSMASFTKQVMEIAAEQGVRVGLIRPITLWPFPEKAVLAAARSSRRVLVAEMNCGQMIEDVRRVVGRSVNVEHFGEPGGTDPKTEDMLATIRSLRGRRRSHGA